MAHNEIYPSGVSHTCLGIEWNSASYTTYVTIAPTIWRWDEVNTANTGGRFSESLSPDPQGAGYWSGLSWGTGSGWRQIDSFATRTYNRIKSAQTVKLTITTDASYGTYWYGWVNYGTKSVSWTLTIDPLPSYNVTFNANSGSGAPATQKKWYNENLTLSSTKPTRTGYTFKQWNTKADGTGTAYAPGASYTGNAALSLYAIWTINTWTVAYNANGHGTAPASQTKTYGTNLTLRSGMGTVSNYVWKSWNTAANGSGTTYGSGAAYSTNGAATMYAQWYAPYTVSYNANGGTGAPASQTKVYNQTLTLSATVPTRANHDFLGWATSATAETPTYRTGDDHSGNATYSTNAALSLYAVWKIAHSNPSISYLNVKRCVSPQNGTPADDGEGCLVTATVAIDNTTEGYLDTVIRSVTVQVGSNAPETVTVGASDTTAQIEFVSSNTLSLTSTYAVKVTVEDSYGFSSYRTSNISIAYFTMHFKEGGHGIAIGKKSTVDDLFDVNMDIRAATGKIVVGPASTVNTVAFNNAGPKIEFQNSNASQNGQLVFTDYDAVHTGATLSWITDQSQSWFHTQYVSATRFQPPKITAGVSYITGNQGTAALYLSKNTGSIWYPAITLDTTSGGSWSIGNYNNENLQFSWASKDNRDSSTNSTTIVNLPNTAGTIALTSATWAATAITSGTLAQARGGTGRSQTTANRTFWCGRALYSNNTGTTGTVTLSETAANFTFMFIGYKNNRGYSGIFVYGPNSKTVVLDLGSYDTSAVGAHSAACAISGTSITRSKNFNNWISSSSYGVDLSGTANVSITHVIGFS